MAGKIVNVGIAVIDVIGSPVNSFPKAGGLELFDRLSVATGGCAMNAAVDLGKMGIENSLIVKVGADMFGDFMIAEAAKYGVDVSRCLKDPTNNTSFSFVAVDSTGERRFIHTMGTNATFRGEEIDLDFVAQHELCYFGGTMIMTAMDGKPMVPTLQAIQKRGVKTLLDTVFVVNVPQSRWQEVVVPVLPYLDYFVPSEPESQAITGLTDPVEMAKWMKDRGAKNVVVKLGEKGVYYSSANGENGLVPAYKVSTVVDTTGAGDSWDAGFLAGLSLGETMAQACQLGNATASFCVQATGASTGIPSLATIREFQAKNKR